MANGTFTQFLDSLRAFESGWDRARYDSGNIVDAQLNQWAGGTVDTFFPQHSSWGDLTDAQWKSMSYASTNSLGFVGYQFGEALLIDLGYYDDTVFFGAGATTNTWDGTWTGKNGVTSLAEFKTEAAQEVAIREAFGFNLKIIENGLSNSGQSLADFIGTSRSYQENGETVTVDLTLTGIMAAAHLRGAYGTLNLLKSNSVSADEFGTSILRYIQQFGDYEAPSIADSIAYFESRVTGDEGLGTPVSAGNGDTSDGDSGGSGSSGTPVVNNADINASNATHSIDWAWGKNVVDDNFDPATGTIFISWIGASALEVTQTAEGVVFSVPSNNQSLTLSGVKLADLDLSKIRALDASARTELASLISTSTPAPGAGGTPDASGGSGTPNKPDMPDMGNGQTPDGGHGNMTGTMTTITLTSPSKTIEGFNAARDMVHIEAGITDTRLQIFEESGDALGLTTRIVVLDEAGGIASTTILKGVGLSNLSLANFSIAEQSAQNEVAGAIGAVITTPTTGSGGYDVVYDNDGSNPATSTGASPEGGKKFRADINADDVVGFDIARDQIDVGGTSVHGMIITKTPNGELAIDGPWSAAMQIFQGVQINALKMSNFATVGNEHFRQDLGGVMSWELGVGPRESDTVYVRSHEYGKHEVINNFDPASMKISFLYFGTRERLSVEDTSAGLKISSLPTGQSMTLTGVTKADLVPGLIEFHHDQVIEDNLEVPFGFTAEAVSLVDRTVLLTPEGPSGASTDGFQVREGDLSGANSGGNAGTPNPEPAPTPEPTPEPAPAPTPEPTPAPTPTPTPTPAPTPTPTPAPTPTPDTGIGVSLAGHDTFEFVDGSAERAELTWNWGKKTAITNFDLEQDIIDLNALMAGQVEVSEADGNLYFSVVGNGGNSTALVGVQAEDLSMSNLTADSWNSVLNGNSTFMQSLTDLGFELG